MNRTVGALALLLALACPALAESGVWINDATNPQYGAAVNAAGQQLVNTEGTKATYTLALIDFLPGTTATDYFCLPGSATKTVRVLSSRVSADATAASAMDVALFKRTALNTGGTSAALTTSITQRDSNDPAPTAVPVSYSVNPTSLGAGNLVRAVSNWFFPATGTPVAQVEVVWDFTRDNGRGIVLRGTSQEICFNLNGVAVPSGLSLYTTIDWTEE